MMHILSQFTRRAATVALVTLAVLAWPAPDAEAGSRYAKWLKHGDVYRVTGIFGEHKRSFRVTLRKRGPRFTVSTPLGTFKLKPAGRGVTFKVLFQKKWAHVRWNRTKAIVSYNKRKGTAQVRKLENRSSSAITKTNLK